MAYHSAEALQERGLELPAPHAVYVDEGVALERLGTGSVLYPGTRIEGARTMLGEGCRIGTLGPVYLRDVAAGDGVVVARGSAEEAVLLDGASLGPDAHVRAGTLLEEGANTAHAVGLKQTILMAFATLGSNINFCDCLLYGGRSRKDHSEVGSGFIHFNFTPFGARGDKATPSLFGDVPRGVLMRDARVFLGGAGGVVGPCELGFGTVTAAGGVYRRDRAGDVLVIGEKLEPRVRQFDPLAVRRVGFKIRRSVAYIGQLRALQAWYQRARIPMAPEGRARDLLAAAVELLEGAVGERVKQVDRLVSNLEVARRERGAATPEPLADAWTHSRAALLEPLLADTGDRAALARLESALEPGRSHLDWVRSLSEEHAAAAATWLSSLVESVAAQLVAEV